MSYDPEEELRFCREELTSRSLLAENTKQDWLEAMKEIEQLKIKLEVMVKSNAAWEEKYRQLKDQK